MYTETFGDSCATFSSRESPCQAGRRICKKKGGFGGGDRERVGGRGGVIKFLVGGHGTEANGEKDEGIANFLPTLRRCGLLGTRK